VLGHILSGL